MEINWYIVNEKLISMEWNKDVENEQWRKEWNEWVDKSKKIAGCIKREKYEESKPKAARKAKAEKAGDGSNVPILHGRLDEEKTL